MTDIRVKILVFQHDGTVVSQYLLGEGVHVIGRDPSSAIYAESEYISNEHAKLHLSDEGVFIEDLNSTAGTFLDDVTVRGKLRLNPGQRLQVGDLYIDLQLEASGDLAPGVKIGAGRYQLVKELGRGAMGQVWLVEDSQLDELVAIKVLPSDVSNDAVALLDLKREVQKSRKLSHDNIIRIHDLVQLPGENPFVSLEYVEGTDLNAIQVNHPDRAFKWEEVKAYVLQLCSALNYAHERRIVHRDLKPSNIMITHDGVLKLADFGIAASITDATGRSSMANFITGTPQFMSPQQMLGKSPKANDDIYALGATIYDLLTGHPPFHTGDIAQQVHHVTPVPIEQRLAEFGLQNSVPDYVNSMVLSCLAKDPEVRPASAGAIAEWIRTEGKSDSPAKRKITKTGIEKMTPEEPIQAGAEPSTSVEAPPQVVKEGRNTLMLALATMVIIAVILGVLFLSGSDEKDKKQDQGNGSQAGGKEDTEGQPAIANQMQAKLKEGLVAYYPFNGDAKDESGNGYDGIVEGALLTTDRHGVSNRSYAFNGSSTYISVSHAPELNLAAKFTISVWVTRAGRSVDGWSGIVCKRRASPGAAGDGYGITNTEDGWQFGSGPWDSRGNELSYDGSPGFSSTHWHHLLYSYDGNKEKVYFDGALILERRSAGMPIGNTEPLTIGGQSGAWAKRVHNGKVDDVRIYDRALSAEEVKALYDLEKPTGPLTFPTVASSFNENGRINSLRYTYTQGSKYNLTDESFKHFADNVELEEIGNLQIGSPESVGITHLCLASFKGYPRLHGLYLYGFMTDVGIKYTAENFPKTEKLYVKGNFTSEGIQELDRLKNLFELGIDSRLDLSDPASFAFIRKLPELKKLQFTRVKFSDPSIQTLVGVAPGLPQLNLYVGKGSTVTDLSLMYLSTMPELQTFHLVLPNGYAGLTLEGLAHFKSNQNLKLLILENMPFPNSAIDDLRQNMPNCKIDMR
jgi:hypothetical protein